jgi:hypothetical protein
MFKLPGRIDPRWVFCCVLLLLAIATRFWQLDTLPYGHNNDETGLAYEGYLLLQESDYRVVVSQARESTLPYLYGFLVKLFGFSNGVIRLPSAAVGVVGCLSLCLLIFRFLPDFWAFCIGLVVVSYGPYLALDRLALRASVCTAVVFVFLLTFDTFKSSERRPHWFVLGVIFGVGFHTYIAYRVMPIVVLALLVIHLLHVRDRAIFWRQLVAFGCGTVVTGWVLLFMFLGARNDYVFFREANVFQKIIQLDSGIWSTLGRNLVELCRMLLGFEMPFPVGVQVPYFHLVWVPFLVFGICSSVRTRARQPQFALLITFVIFLVPVLLSDEFFARRYLTSLVLAVALTGIGAYEATRRVGWDRNGLVRGAVLLLAIGVASSNVWFYFGAYASRPKWDQGPFSAAHRWVGAILRDEIDADSKMLFADEVGDPWSIELYLVGIVVVSEQHPAVMRMYTEYDDRSSRQIESFCRTPDPIYFLSTIDTPQHVSDLVRRACDTTRRVPIEWPADIVPGDDMEIIVATRPEF